MSKEETCPSATARSAVVGSILLGWRVNYLPRPTPLYLGEGMSLCLSTGHIHGMETLSFHLSFMSCLEQFHTHKPYNINMEMF